MSFVLYLFLCFLQVFMIGTEYSLYIVSAILGLGGVIWIFAVIYFIFFSISKTQKYLKISVVPNDNAAKSKGYVFKFTSFIMNAYTMPEDWIRNKMVLEIDWWEVFNRFAIYVPSEYGEDYIRMLRSHYPDAFLEYDFNKLENNQLSDDYNYSYFRHSSAYPLGKKLEELEIVQNISAIINSIKEWERLQMILNFEWVMEMNDARKDIELEVEQIKIWNMWGTTNIYKKIFSTIRFLSKTKTPKIMSIWGLMWYIFEKNWSMRNTRVKVGSTLKVYPSGWKDKMYNFLYNLWARGKQFLWDFSKADGFYLSEWEIAGLFNFVAGSKLETIQYKKLDPKNAYQRVKTEAEKWVKWTKIWWFDYPWYEDKTFTLSDLSKRKHIYCIWKTGMGKSTVLSQLMKDDIEKWKWFALFDPNWDLAKDVMEFIPESRKDDVVYICPASPIWNVSLWIFDFLRVIRDNNIEEAQAKITAAGTGIMTNNLDVLASNLVSVVRSVSIGWSEMWGPRMDMLLRAWIKAVLGSSDKATIADLITFYNDAEFRKAILRRVTNFHEKAMWEKTESMDPKEVEIWYQPIRNRLINYSTEVFLWLFSTKPKFDLNAYINDNKILIFDLAKWPTGTDIGRFTGTVMFALIWEFIQLRAKIPKNERKDYSVYIDEFQNYVTETFTAVLSEARKYALSLVIAHQYLDQIKWSDVLPAVLGNCGTVISLQIWVEDGKKLSKFFWIDEQDLASIPPYKAYVKSNDYSTESFNILTFPIVKDPNIKYVDVEDLMLYSYWKYGTTQEDIQNNVGLYWYFIKNKRLPDEIMNVKEDTWMILASVEWFDTNHCWTDVEINEKNKLVAYTVKDEDLWKTWWEVSKYMWFSNYSLFEENLQTFWVVFKNQNNKVQKNYIWKTIVVYYGWIVK